LGSLRRRVLVVKNTGEEEKKTEVERDVIFTDVCTARSRRERVVAILDGATFWAWRRLGDATLFARRAQEATRWPQGRIEM